MLIFVGVAVFDAKTAVNKQLYIKSMFKALEA